MNAYQEEILKAVDNLAAEIARVQHVVEQAFPVNESKPMVDDVVTYDGQPYKLVDRLAQVGDVVVLTNECEPAIVPTDYELNKPYKVEVANTGYGSNLAFIADIPCVVYRASRNRTPETVKVYEPTTWEAVQEKATQEVQKRAIRCGHVAPTPNVQRKVIIEKAKQFVESAIERGRDRNAIKGDAGNETYKAHFYTIDFFTKKDQVTALVTRTGAYGRNIKSQPDHVARAKCNPSDVFNEHIGKAIALGRALGLDVSEFANAVQPNKPVVGHTVYWDAYGYEEEFEVREIEGTKLYDKNGLWVHEREVKITDDTNAQY